MRSLLIVSEPSPEAIEEALTSGPDALLIGVDSLLAVRGRNIEPRLYVMVTPLEASSSLLRLSKEIAARPSGVALLECSGGADLQQIGARLAVQEAQAGLPEGVLRMIAFASDTAAAVHGLSTYSGASARLEALVASAASLRSAVGSSTGFARALQHGPAQLARNLTVIAARASGVFALDAPFRNVNDLGGLRAQAAAARVDGFDGKIAIDPRQVKIINETFA